MFELYLKNKKVIDITILIAWIALIPLWYITNNIDPLLLFLLLFAFRLEYFWNVFKNITEISFGTVDAFFQIASFLFFAFSAIGVFFWQIYAYLKHGIWQGVSIITCLQYFKNTWAIRPNDWQGLWNILNMIPLSILLLVIAVIILFDHD